MLLQVQEGKMMSLREGMRVMAAEGGHAPSFIAAPVATGAFAVVLFVQ
jgi:hypothetical protein